MESKSTPYSSPKTKIDQVIDGLFTYLQRRWQLLALVILYIFFRPTFESKLIALLQSFEPSWGSFIAWLGIIVTALTYTYVLCRRRYVISEGVLSWTAFLLLGWAYYRFIGVEDYVATPTQIPGICYVDFLPFCGGCMAFVVWWSHRYRTKPKQEGMDNSIRGYEVECPCTSEDEDLLGRGNEAQDLAEKIFQTDTSNAAFTIGLTAPWGAGKTSFMLAMKDHLKKQHSDETILLDFNPWMYRKAPNLTQVFFEELSRTLAPYSSALASGFMQYVDYILSKENNSWIQLGAHLLPQGFKAKSTSEQYEFLKKGICKLGRKIMIFIDDVDRLDGEELTELFSLVRNISSFPNMSYILAYDKEYVTTQLQNKFNEHTYRYMEKIVQVEYPLAKITPEQLEEALREELKRIGYGSLWNPIKNSSFQLTNHLPTLRVIKQICNTLSSRRKELEGNIALSDWFIIEVIRIQYPRLFDFLRENYSRVFYIQGDKRSIRLKEVKEHEKSRKEEPLADHPSYGSEIDFYKHISEHHKSLQIKSVGLVIELLRLVWDEARDAEVPQANHGDYIGRYFYGTLRECEIDETEFREHVNLSFEEIKAYIQQKRASQIPDLIQKVRREPAESQEKAQILLQILLYLFSDPSRLFRIDQVTEKVDSLKKYLKEASLKSIFKEIFEHPDTSVGALRYLSCIAGDEDNVNKLPFTQDEIETIKETLFLRYVEESKPLDLITCYNLWELAHINTGPQPNVGMCHPKMDEKMKQIIVENIESLIPIFIEQYREDERIYKLLYPKAIWNLDADRKNPAIGYFPEFIFGLDGDSSPIIREFQEFLRKRLESEEPLITFEFKYITPANVWWKKSS